jgi:hypothetical protein
MICAMSQMHVKPIYGDMSQEMVSCRKTVQAHPVQIYPGALTKQKMLNNKRDFTTRERAQHTTTGLSHCTADPVVRRQRAATEGRTTAPNISVGLDRGPSPNDAGIGRVRTTNNTAAGPSPPHPVPHPNLPPIMIHG